MENDIIRLSLLFAISDRWMENATNHLSLLFTISNK